MTQICAKKQGHVIISSDNGLFSVRCQAFAWTSDGLFFIQSLGTAFSDISIKYNNLMGKMD